MGLDSFVSYLQLERKYSAHTIKAYSKDVNEFKEYCSEHYQLKNVKDANYPLIRSWIVQLVEQGVSNRSVSALTKRLGG